MIVYIPFNSNNFNSVFSTLSISPNSFYADRKYGFKRVTPTLMSRHVNVLVAFTNPVFHMKKFDDEQGFTILLEVNLRENPNRPIFRSEGFEIHILDDTIYLFEHFRLVFRTENERAEVFAKSLKSLETKFAGLAKLRSVIVNPNYIAVKEPPSIPFRQLTSSKDFRMERSFNRCLGSTLCSLVAAKSDLEPEWASLNLLEKKLANILSLYLNRLSETNLSLRDDVIKNIELLRKGFDNILPLDEAIALLSSFPTSTLSNLKEWKICSMTVYELLLLGLLEQSKIDLPFQLQIDRLLKALTSRINIKYPRTYIEKVERAWQELSKSLSKEIRQQQETKVILDTNIIRFKPINGAYIPTLPSNLMESESMYLKETIAFFVVYDYIFSVEDFFVKREQVLKDLGIHYKNTIPSFGDSEERAYLGKLLKSFESIRLGFDASGTTNEVMRVIGVLFTSGRDFEKFLEGCERERISSLQLYLPIWGAIYGLATLPKTVTEIVTIEPSNMSMLLHEFKRLRYQTESNSITDVHDHRAERSLEISVFPETQSASSIHADDVIKSSGRDQQAEIKALTPMVDLGTIDVPVGLSEKAKQILQIVEAYKRIPLADIKSKNKTIGNVETISKLIHSELSDRIHLAKVKSKLFAELIETDLYSALDSKT